MFCQPAIYIYNERMSERMVRCFNEFIFIFRPSLRRFSRVNDKDTR